MSFEHWETFAAFAHSSIMRYYASSEAGFDTYCEKLTNLTSEIIGEKRRTLLDPELSHNGRIMYIDSIISKLNLLHSNLFEECSEGLRFLPDGFIITDDTDKVVSSARQLKKNILALLRDFRLEMDKIHGQNHLVGSAPRSHKRVATRESFEIVEGKDINLRAVHRNLIDRVYPFIEPNTTYDDFEIAFSGAPVTNKVSWLYANALHYFIDNIHGVGVERANEGQWARASRCFTVNGKDITPDQIKDAGDPVASVTAILDRAIAPFL